MNKKGFTLVELLMILVVVMCVCFILLGVGWNVFIDNRGRTQDRAYINAKQYLIENHLDTKRLTCAGDSDRDGYGTCNVVTMDNEKIILNCPCDYIDVVWFEATMCKEVFQNENLMLNFNQNQ